MPPTTVGRYAEAWVEAAWLSLLVLVPLHFERYSREIFESHKVSLLLCGALAIGLGWLTRASEGAGFSFPSGGGLLRALVLFVGAECLSTLVSVDPWTAFRGTIYRRQGLLTLLAYVLVFAAVVRFGREPARRRRLLTTWILTSLPICLYGLVQRVGLDPLSWSQGGETRVSSTLGNPIFLGSVVMLALFPTLARLLECLEPPQASAGPGRGRTIRGGAYGLLLAIQMATLLATGSRGPILGSLAGIVAFGACALRWSGRRSLGRVMLVLGGVSLGAAIVVLGTRALGDRADPEESDPLWEGVEQSILRAGSIRERMLAWDAYLDMYLSRKPVRLVPRSAAEPPPPDRLRVLRPWIGYGPDVAGEVFPQHVPRALFDRRGPGGTADRAHNEAWDRLIAGGVVGLVAWSWLLIRILERGMSASGLRMDRRGRERATRAAIGGAALAGASALLWPGPSFFGVGFQAGLAAGILVFLALARVRRRRVPPPVEAWALLASLIAYLVDGTVGFGVATTNLVFWVFAALLVGGQERRGEGAGRFGGYQAQATRSAGLAFAAILLLMTGSIGFDLFGGGPMVPDRSVIEAAPPSELLEIAVAGAGTARAVWPYAGGAAFLLVTTSILTVPEAGRRPRSRTWVLLLLGLPALLVGVELLGIRQARADILAQSGLRWRGDATRLRAAAGADPSATIRAGVLLLEEAVRIAPRVPEYRIHLAEAASAAALLMSTSSPGRAEQPSDDATTGRREELFSLSVTTLLGARPWYRASPLVPLNLAYVQGRWAQGSRDAGDRALHVEQAEAWLVCAREMYPAGFPVERWLGDRRPGAPRGVPTPARR